MSHHRSFYDITGGTATTLIAGTATSNVQSTSNSAAKVVHSIQSSVIGGNHVFKGAFGPRPCIYADWTASGRSLEFIEEYIRAEVLPFYGNTHTTSSITGLQVGSYQLAPNPTLTFVLTVHTLPT